MPADLARTLLRALEVFRPAFTASTFARWLLLCVGWILCVERHAITECLVVTGIATVAEHSAFHRCFARARWEPDRLGLLLLTHVRSRWPHLPLRFVIDDTLAPHKGPQVFGLGCHVDAVRSTRKTKVFTFGHVWVTLALVVQVPFSTRPWAIPLLARLYRNKKACADAGAPYRTKTALARELIEVVLGWLPTGVVTVLLDSGYANRTVLRGLPDRVQVVASATATVARSEDAPGRTPTGRPRARGAALPKLAAWAADEGCPWQTVEADVYGGRRTLQIKTCVAQWWPVFGVRAVRFVLVRCATGRLPWRVFLSTDLTLSPASVLEEAARRWATEVFYFDVKQHLGFAASRAWRELAVRRMAPWTALLYGTLVVWFWGQYETGTRGRVPERPWYPQKAGYSFADILRTARWALDHVDVIAVVEAVAPLRILRPHDTPPKHVSRAA